MFPPRFITPPRKPIFDRVPIIEGTDQYNPHQRRKNNVDDSRAITMSELLAYETEKIDAVATIAAKPNKVRITRLGEAPLALHLSAIQPPASSPANPQRKTRKLAAPMAAMLKLWTLFR